MRNGLTKYEQEVNITFNRDEQTAHLYSSDPIWIRRMDRLVADNPKDFKLEMETSTGKSYLFPKKFLRLAKRQLTHELTPEQKEAAKARLLAYQEKRRREKERKEKDAEELSL
jgi:hypothetical protein